MKNYKEKKQFHAARSVLAYRPPNNPSGYIESRIELLEDKMEMLRTELNQIQTRRGGLQMSTRKNRLKRIAQSGEYLEDGEHIVNIHGGRAWYDGVEINDPDASAILEILSHYDNDSGGWEESAPDVDPNQLELPMQANRKNRLKKLAQIGRGITMSDLYNYAKSLFKERGKSINNEEWSGMNDNVKITSADGMFDVDIKRMDGRWHVFYEGKREEYSPEGNPNELGNYEPLGPDVDIAGGYGDG